MIVVRRSVISDEIKSARIDKLFRESMADRGYALGETGVEHDYRFMEFDGASMEVEQRDYTNSIIADILSMRVPGILIDIEIRPMASRVV